MKKQRAVIAILLYKERMLFTNRSAATVFFSSVLHQYLFKHAKQHMNMLLIYQETFFDIFLFECFIKAQLNQRLKLM